MEKKATSAFEIKGLRIKVMFNIVSSTLRFILRGMCIANMLGTNIFVLFKRLMLVESISLAPNFSKYAS